MAGVDEASFWCENGETREVLGTYDGVETWTLTASALAQWDDQVYVSRHEHLHHLLQLNTPWGLVAKLAADLARGGVASAQLSRLSRFCRAQSRTVHAAYATTLSVAVDREARKSLSPDYQVYLDRGLRLAGNDGWETGRFAVDAVLRLCMAPTALGLMPARGIRGLRIEDLDLPLARPDDRLAVVLASDMPYVSPAGLNPESSDELAAYFDELASVLTGVGVPTLPTGAVRDLMDELHAQAAALSPALGTRTSMLTEEEIAGQGVEHYQRQAIQLRGCGPLPVEVVPIGKRAPRWRTSCWRMTASVRTRSWSGRQPI